MNNCIALFILVHLKGFGKKKNFLKHSKSCSYYFSKTTGFYVISSEQNIQEQTTLSIELIGNILMNNWYRIIYWYSSKIY